MTGKNFTLHWTFAPVRKTISEHGEQELYTCASGVTPSGTIHIGNFRELITVDLVTRAFRRMGKKARHIHSWDDNDVFRKVPQNMPQQEMLKENLRKCIVDVPDPFGEEKSYAAKHMKDVRESIAKVGIKPDYIVQSKKYRTCEYAEQIKEALIATDKIKDILNEHRKEPLKKDWLPVSIFCESCKKDTIKILDYPGGYNLHYKCECGHEDTFDFRKKGIVKLLWRVDWPMRWAHYNEHFEPSGKDHMSAGGSNDMAQQLVEKIFNGHKTYAFMYEFIGIKGGAGKMSSSSGNVYTVSEILKYYIPEVFRYLYASTKPNSPFDVQLDENIFQVYNQFYTLEQEYYTNLNEKNTNKEILKDKSKVQTIPNPTKTNKNDNRT
jgi:lysyl-tRNA synthetase class 1